VRAVVLLSGGMDSATCLALAKHAGHQVSALTVDYGQRHRQEIDAARAICAAAGVTDHRVVTVDLTSIGGSALTDTIAVPKDRDLSIDEIPATYVPARNTVLLALGLGLCEVLGAEALYLGATAVDYSGYPDCRPDYFVAFEKLATLATVAALHGRPVRIMTPLLHLSKAEIARTGVALGVDYGLTLSCYDPGSGGAPCGHCDACRLRRKGFEEAGIIDPAAREV
jgi:7-cyano-7-deazaguanine synthase